MLYKQGKMLETNSGKYDYIIVDAAVDGEIEKHLEQGWFKTTTEADNADLDIDDDGEVTRNELETKAIELGIKFDGRTSDKKLYALIEEKLGE